MTTLLGATALPKADLSFDGLSQFRRVKPHSAPEHDLRISYVPRGSHQVPADDRQIRLHTGLNRADPFVEAENLRPVRRHDLNGLFWREPRLDEQLVVALVTVT